MAGGLAEWFCYFSDLAVGETAAPACFLREKAEGADGSTKENKMIIDHPGKVTERIFLLGEKASCVYLLKGNSEYAILGGGMTYVVPDVIRQLQEFNIEEKKIKQMVILHSHFDHCGIVPFFKRRWPWIKIYHDPLKSLVLKDRAFFLGV